MKKKLNKYNLRFDYHVNKFGIHHRTVKLWWKPFYWLGNKLKNILYDYGVRSYSKEIWFIRKYLTLD